VTMCSCEVCTNNTILTRGDAMGGATHNLQEKQNESPSGPHSDQNNMTLAENSGTSR
jgi:hypothetical protein